MTTGQFDGDTARSGRFLEDRRDVQPASPYRALWAILLLGWVISYADRTLTGPVIAWMIQNKSGFIGDAANPSPWAGWSVRCSSWATC